MPATKDQLRSLVDEVIKNINSHDNFNEWIWPYTANPDLFIHVDDAGNVRMTDEVRAVFDTRAKSGGHLDTQVEGEPRISMNAFGPGIHTVEMVLKMTREKGLVEGMPNVTRHFQTSILDDNCKFIRMITSPADETTKSAFEKLIKAQEAAAGAPEGGFLEVIELYKDLEKSLPNVDEAVKRLADDGIFIDPFGGVLIGRDQYEPRSRAWYALGFRGWKHVGPIHTPAKDTVWTMVQHDFGGVPEGAIPVQNPPPGLVNYKFDLKTGKVVRGAIITTSFEGNEWSRHFAAWVGKQQQAPGRSQEAA